MYQIGQYNLVRNDDIHNGNGRPYGGTAVSMYSRIDYYPGYPFCCNRSGIEIIAIRLMVTPHITIIGIYCSPRVPVSQFCTALRQTLVLSSTKFNVFIGDFNINWLNEYQRKQLYDLFVKDNNYRQLVSCYTTDNKTCIDHVHTNLPETHVNVNILETCFSDHKGICAVISCFS